MVGLAYVYLFVFGLFYAFFVHEEFFEELLARAKAREFDLYVFAWFVSRQAYQVTRKVIYLDWISHVENEYLPAPCHCAGLENEADRLGYCHEVANYVGVGNCNRAHVGYLSLEYGDYAAA